MKTSNSTFLSRLFADKQLFLIVLLLLASIIALGTTFWFVAKKSREDKDHIRLSGELRVLSQNIVKNAAEASSARVEAFPLLKDSRDKFDKILHQLQNGDPALGLPPSDKKVDPELKALAKRWSEFRDNADIIFQAEGTIRQLSEFVNHINNTMPNLLALSDEVVGIMIEIGAKAQQIYIASRQLMLSQRMSFNVNKILQGDRPVAAEGLKF